MHTEKIDILIEGEASAIKEAIAELQLMERVDSISSSAEIESITEKLLSRKPQNYTEIIAIAVSIATNLASSYIYDFFKSRGLKIKEKETTEKNDSDIDDTKT